LRRSAVIPALWAAVILVLCGGTAAIAAQRSTSLPGWWSGKYSGAYSGTFSLHWTMTGSRLHGSITLSNPKGSYPVSGKVGRGGAIQFGVVGAGATYTGSASGSSMSGSYKSPRGGGSWSAHKVSTRVQR
jgi:hypothetical protein